MDEKGIVSMDEEKKIGCLQYTYRGRSLNTLLPPSEAGKVYDCEPYGTFSVLNYLRPGDVFVDVGAHIGCYTLFGAEAVGPSGKVIALEPGKGNYELLCENVKINGFENVETHRVGVGDSSQKTATLYGYDPAGNAHQLWVDGYKSMAFFEEVPVLTVDDLSLERVNVLKIDAQGYELRVLKGALSTIKRQSKMALLIEYWPYGLKGLGDSPEELWDIVTNKLGFLVHIINDFVPMGLILVSAGMDVNSILERYGGAVNLWCLKV